MSCLKLWSVAGLFLVGAVVAEYVDEPVKPVPGQPLTGSYPEGSPQYVANVGSACAPQSDAARRPPPKPSPKAKPNKGVQVVYGKKGLTSKGNIAASKTGPGSLLVVGGNYAQGTGHAVTFSDAVRPPANPPRPPANPPRPPANPPRPAPRPPVRPPPRPAPVVRNTGVRVGNTNQGLKQNQIGIVRGGDTRNVVNAPNTINIDLRSLQKTNQNTGQASVQGAPQSDAPENPYRH
ncbi:hypothetical protein ANCCEY_05654 [Ancylostoma ceylanicum]|uniref:Uncharacterized protein n=2 Tax=Ancylostoma ceylanicum TaxID=53326 RepID=A0A8I3B0I9_9BILA|nr:hypothetical protein ANCCEY_05654 [Ancylostoma ceylanicum]EYB98337.1 hypothetical protein Y032_0132g1726 [Ancylostoma ceylanicum]